MNDTLATCPECGQISVSQHPNGDHCITPGCPYKTISPAVFFPEPAPPKNAAGPSVVLHPYAQMIHDQLEKGNPPPFKDNGTPSMHDLAHIVLLDRFKSGLIEYGTPLQVGNGRDFGWDRVEEHADALVYAIGDWIDRQNMKQLIAELRKEHTEESEANAAKIMNLENELFLKDYKKDDGNHVKIHFAWLFVVIFALVALLIVAFSKPSSDVPVEPPQESEKRLTIALPAQPIINGHVTSSNRRTVLVRP